MAGIRVSDLGRELAKEIGRYSDEVNNILDNLEEKYSKIAVKKLRVAGNFETHRSKKEYKKGWRAKRSPSGGWVVYNATNPGLTHLLERGHALASGGRTRAFPHIAPIEQQIIRDFEREVREALRN